MKKLLLAALLLLSAPAYAQISLRHDPMTGSQDYTTFNCTMVSTAITLTAITGCGAPGAGLRYYIKQFQWSSSIISSTTDYMKLRAGTGANCGTATVDVWSGYVVAAFSHAEAIFDIPLILPINNLICFIHTGAGTRTLNLQGYIAP